jgi:hypothetical protein
MVLSNKIFKNIDLEGSETEEEDDIITDELEIQQLEKRLMENYMLLQKKRKDIKKKEKNNYLLNSLSVQYDKINKNMNKEINHLIKHLQLLNGYIEENKKENKQIINFLKEEQKKINMELNKIKSLHSL